MKSEKEKLGYALGLSIAKNLQEQGFEDFDQDALLLAVKHHYDGSELQLTVEQINETLKAASTKIQSEKHGPVLENGQKFLQENSNKEGITVLDSGMQYRVMKSGSGKSPQPTDQVTTHYHGKLIDGTVFDSSVDRGAPASFPVNGVIQGWQEALPMMKEGDKWELFIPHNLAYGEQGAGKDIAPFSTLIFEVELISVN
ncbi:MAG: FKBP-type peptidyl-prolyl cis-trans isomerase [Flavobacteriales bacterium]|nr:FKBP-type peptidyl-prolyl cis-trans isomerase [Flavobacteriales bacterium]